MGEKEKKKKSSLVQLALIYICKVLSDNFSEDLCESEEWLAVHCGMCWSVSDFPAPATVSTARIYGNTACQGSPAPTTQAQLPQGLLQHKFRCVQVILYLRFSHICQSSPEVALRKQSSSTAGKLHIDRAVVSPECSSCAGLPSEGCKANSQPSLRAWQESSGLESCLLLREGVKRFKILETAPVTTCCSFLRKWLQSCRSRVAILAI